MKRIRRALALFLVLTLGAALFASPAAAADSSASTMRLESKEGTVTVKNASGLSVQFKEKMRLYDGYSVKTGSASYAYVSLDGSKTMKLDASSEVSISKTGKKLEIALVSGSIFFDVSQPLQRDERMNIRTSTMVTGIRGTSGCVSKPDRQHSEVTLLSGTVEVIGTASGAAEAAVTLNAGERAVVTQEEDAAAQAQPVTITKQPVQPEALPGFAAVEVARSPELQSKIAAETDLSVPALIADAAERQAADESFARRAEAFVQRMLEQQQQQSRRQAVDPVFRSETAPSGGGSSGGGSGGGGSSGGGRPAPAPVNPAPPEPAPVTHTVTFTGENFSASPAMSYSVGDGQNFFFKLTPHPGYVITSVACNGPMETLDANAGEYYVGPVTFDITIDVAAELLHTVTITGENFTASPAMSNSVEDGQSLTFTLTPSAGYGIASVTCNGQELPFDRSTGECRVGPVTAGMTIEVTAASTTLDLPNPTLDELKAALETGYLETINLYDTNLVLTEPDLTFPRGKTLNLESGTLSFQRSALIEGELSTAAGTTLAFTGDGHGTAAYVQMSKNSALTVNGSLVMDQGAVLGNRGTLTLPSGSSTEVAEIKNTANLTNGDGGIMKISRKLTVDGDSVSFGRGSLSNIGTLTVESGGELKVTSNGTLSVTDSGTLTVDNGGALTLDNGNTLTLERGGTLINRSTVEVNSGTLSVYSGTLEITGGYVGTDSDAYNSTVKMTIGENSTVELSGGVLRVAEITGSGTGNGTFNWTGGTIECKEASGSPVGSKVTLTPAVVGTPTLVSGKTDWYSWPLS